MGAQIIAIGDLRRKRERLEYHARAKRVAQLAEGRLARILQGHDDPEPPRAA
jgi:hypothetical protein